MSQGRHSEAAFETVIKAEPLQNGRMGIAPKGVDRERTIALLKERRAALIAPAVSGQLDVGEFAA
jgi:hypothetical protein